MSNPGVLLHRTGADGELEKLFLSTENMQKNILVLYWSRQYACVLGGIVAGILGLTGLQGLSGYAATMALTAFGLFAKMGFSYHKYFESWKYFSIDGFTSGAMTFLLFWVLMYNVVHTY